MAGFFVRKRFKALSLYSDNRFKFPIRIANCLASSVISFGKSLSSNILIALVWEALPDLSL
jgi:hypothetical protein